MIWPRTALACEYFNSSPSPVHAFAELRQVFRVIYFLANASSIGGSFFLHLDDFNFVNTLFARSCLVTKSAGKSTFTVVCRRLGADDLIGKTGKKTESDARPTRNFSARSSLFAVGAVAVMACRRTCRYNSPPPCRQAQLARDRLKLHVLLGEQFDGTIHVRHGD